MIDTVGDYRTRNGSRVRIDRISDGPETFKAKGAIYKIIRGKLRPRGYEIWALDGRFKALGQSPLDIVEKWRW